MTDDEKWLFAYEMLKDFHSGMVVPTKKFAYSNNGLASVPVQQTRYVDAIGGKELPPKSGVIFLDRGFYRGRDGELHRHLIKCGSNGITTTKLIWAVVRNTLLLQKLSGVSVREDAIGRTIRWYIGEICNCPIDLIVQLSDVCTYIALLLIDEHSDKTPEELKAVTPKLNFSQSRVVNRYLRSKFKESLISHDIQGMRYREDQIGLIDVLLKTPQYSQLDTNAFRKKLVEWMRVKGWLRPIHDGKENRAFEIKRKVANKIALSSSELKFRKRHPELFKN